MSFNWFKKRKLAKSLRSQLDAALKDYTQARKRYENAIKRKTTQLQHEAAKDVQAALHSRMRIEMALRDLGAA